MYIFTLKWFGSKTKDVISQDENTSCSRREQSVSTSRKPNAAQNGTGRGFGDEKKHKMGLLEFGAIPRRGADAPGLTAVLFAFGFLDSAQPELCCFEGCGLQIQNHLVGGSVFLTLFRLFCTQTIALIVIHGSTSTINILICSRVDKVPET